MFERRSVLRLVVRSLSLPWGTHPELPMVTRLHYRRTPRRLAKPQSRLVVILPLVAYSNPKQALVSECRRSVALGKVNALIWTALGSRLRSSIAICLLDRGVAQLAAIVGEAIMGICGPRFATGIIKN